MKMLHGHLIYEVINERMAPRVSTGEPRTFFAEEMLLSLLDAFAVAAGTEKKRHFVVGLYLRMR